MSVKSKKESLLTSWKDIASYFDCDVRTCRRWEIKHGLPVHRIDEASSSRVYAYEDELERWFESRFKQKSIPEGVSYNKFRWYKSYYFLLAFIAIILIYFFLIKPSKPQKPADFKIENSSLIVLNENGQELWRYDTGIKNLCDEKYYEKRFQIKEDMEENAGRTLPHLIIKDLNGNGNREVLFCAQTKNQYGSGEILCFSEKGTLLWNKTTGREIKYGPKIYSPDYNFGGIVVDDMDRNGKQEIIVIAYNTPFFPTQLLLLNSEGEILGEYWNSGRINDVAFLDLNNDGRKEIIIAGINNEYHKGFLAVFSSTLVRGGSPQKENYYTCTDLEPGTEKYYILIPRTDVSLLEFVQEGVSQLNILKNKRLSILICPSMVFYEFDYNLEIQEARLSTAFEALNKKLVSEGKVNRVLDEEYRKNLAQGLLYYDGKSWVSHHTINMNWKNQEK